MLTFGGLTAAPQPFEQALLGVPVWRVTVDGAAAQEDIAALTAGARAQGVGLVACRLAEGDPACALLAAAGFRAVETLLTFEGPLDGSAAMPEAVRDGTVADIAACRAVACAAFRYDRYHIDPAIDDRAADAIKAQWIENALKGRADRVFVADADGAVVGFNACLLAGDAVVIDLIGVDPRAQGRGIGRALVAGAVAAYAGRAQTIRAGTQADNTTSRRLYGRFGMEIVRRALTYHWTDPQSLAAAAGRAAAVEVR